MLIVFEGIDGSGKTTLAADLAARLRAAGHAVIETREPWTSPEGETLRRLLSQADRTTTPRQEFDLFHADRRLHVAQVVRPALARQEWVVQDRTFYSTAAYQGAVGLPVDEILRSSRQIAPEPDLVFLLDLEPEVALQRIERDRGSSTRFERLANLQRVRQLYRDLARRHRNFVMLDAEDPLEQLKGEVASLCSELVGAP